jgi:hypothetical protein
MTDPIMASLFSGIPAWLIVTWVIIGVWSSIWKAFALWKSARKHHMAWFIVMFIVNTVGILELLYIFWFSKIGDKKNKKK